MKYGIIEKDLFKEISEKDFKKLSKEKREIYIPIKHSEEKEDNTVIEIITDEYFIKDLDYGESAKLFRTALDEMNESETSNIKGLIIGIVILIVGILLGLVIGMSIGKGSSNEILNTPPPIVSQDNNIQENNNILENSGSTNIENKSKELQDKLMHCEIEVVKLQTKIEYIPKNTIQCPICDDNTMIKLELEQCKKEYENLFTEERKFLDYIGKTIYDNCKNSESEYCKDLYFKFRQNGL